MSMLADKEQFLTDANGKRTGVVLDLATYERLRETGGRSGLRCLA